MQNRFALEFFFPRNGKKLYFCSPKRQPLYRRQNILREESPGSAEPPYFLTGRDAGRKPRATASAAENIPLILHGYRSESKGENARQGLTTGAVMRLMVNLMG